MAPQKSDETKIQEALAALRLNSDQNIQKVADIYGVDRSTLSRRFRNVTQSREEGYDSQRLLSAAQSTALLKYINDLTERGLPPTNAMVRTFAAGIAGRQPGDHWVDRWVAAHQDKIKSAYLLPIDKARKKADSALYYSLYFELLGRKMEEYKIEPENMYNMDEKGFLIGFLQKAKRIFTKAAFEAGRVKHVSQDGNREWITVLACICADGSTLSPGLIYQATSGNIQDTWLQDFDPKEQSCFFASSLTGWTNDDLAFSWLQRVFEPETKKKAVKGRWRLLIVDGHGSHVNMRFLDFCRDHKILVAVYPPHSTHRLQPLDVSLFAPLATAYSQGLNRFQIDCEGYSRFTKRDFFSVFYKAWQTSFTPKNIASGWSKTGIYPFNPGAVLDKFMAKPQEERPSSSESTKSVLTAHDWVKIEKKLKEVVVDVFDSRVRELKETIHNLAATNILLEERIAGYQRALTNERKKRERQKPLFKRLAASEDGGAVFYSPKKVQQARDLIQAEKDAKDREQAAKADQQIQRQLQKEEKSRLAAEKREEAACQRKQKEANAEAKRAAAKASEEAKEAQKNIARDLRSARRTKTKQNTKILEEEDSDFIDAGAAEGIMPEAADCRPQRARRRPQHLKGYEINIS